jgi:uncharacterized repeat protein (TIGR01451 family)
MRRAAGGLVGLAFLSALPATAAALLEIASRDGDHRWNEDPVIPYAVTVTNAGPDTADDVQVSSRVPVMTTFDAAASSEGWSCPSGAADQVCTISLGDLAPFESRSVTFAARVVDGTDPQWGVFYEAQTNPCTVECTERDQRCTPEQFEENFIGCCVAELVCLIDQDRCFPGDCDVYQATCPGTAAPVVARPAGADERVRLVLLYQLRDRHLHGTVGGRRATVLYYRHSVDMMQALVANPSLVSLAMTALQAWQPAIIALLTRTPATVSAAQLQALGAFLDALGADATGALAGAIDRGRARLALETWQGITVDEALARLDRRVCTVAATYGSVACRLGDAAELIETRVPEGGALAPKLLAALQKAATSASAAEAAAAEDDRRGTRKNARKAVKLAGKIARRAGSRRGQREIPEAVRTELGTSLEAIRADLRALLRA